MGCICFHDICYNKVKLQLTPVRAAPTDTQQPSQPPQHKFNLTMFVLFMCLERECIMETTMCYSCAHNSRVSTACTQLCTNDFLLFLLPTTNLIYLQSSCDWHWISGYVWKQLFLYLYKLTAKTYFWPPLVAQYFIQLNTNEMYKTHRF